MSDVRAAIPPVSADAARPHWSVMIPTHNCAAYLRHTLASVLAQDPGADMMQIEVVDDASDTDDPEAVVQELGGGRVTFFRQPRNVGHTRNFDTCLQRARGHLVHLLHGDDLVLPGFYARMQRAFEQAPNAGAAFCRHIFIDEAGNWTAVSALEQRHAGVIADWLERIAVGCRVQPPAMVVRRSVYEEVGGFDRRIRRYGEDWEMWVRIAARHPVWYEPEPLAAYRSRTTSLSGVAVRSAENMADLRRAVDAFAEHLPAEDADRLVHAARLNLAGFALKKSLWLLDSGETSAAAAQIREAAANERSARTLAATACVGAIWLCRRAGLRLPLGPGTPAYVALRRLVG